MKMKCVEAAAGKRGDRKSAPPPFPSCGKHKKLLICTSQNGKELLSFCFSFCFDGWKEASAVHPAILPSNYPAILQHPKICGINKFIMSCANVNVFLNISPGFAQRQMRLHKSSGKQTFNDLFRVQLQESTGDWFRQHLTYLF